VEGGGERGWRGTGNWVGGGTRGSGERGTRGKGRREEVPKPGDEGGR